MGWEVERGVSRPYLKDLVFIQNDPVFMKSGKKFNRHTRYHLLFLNINRCISRFNHRKHETLIIFFKLACMKECIVLYLSKVNGD